MSSNWKEILRAQEEDLQRMEEMDAALNDDQIDLDENISSIMKSTKSRVRQPPKRDTRNDDDDFSNMPRRDYEEPRRESSGHNVKLDMGALGMHDDDNDEEDITITTSRSEQSILSPSGRLASSPGGKVNAKQAPDTAARCVRCISIT